MNGIRIKGKALTDNNIQYRIDYQFRALVSPISELIKDMYWILEDAIFESQENDSEFNSYVIQTFPNDSDRIILCEKGFLYNFSKFLIPDNTDIYGFTKRVNLWEALDRWGNIKQEFILSEVDVYFSCIDAAYWEVYSRYDNILKKIEDKFPYVEKVTRG
jgi:hypothetical protein